MKYEWREPETSYSSGERLYVNNVLVGQYIWRSIYKDEKKPYMIETELPGFSPKNKQYETVESAKHALQEFTKRWFSRFLEESE